GGPRAPRGRAPSGAGPAPPPADTGPPDASRRLAAGQPARPGPVRAYLTRHPDRFSPVATANPDGPGRGPASCHPGGMRPPNRRQSPAVAKLCEAQVWTWSWTSGRRVSRPPPFPPDRAHRVTLGALLAYPAADAARTQLPPQGRVKITDCHDRHPK